MTVSEPFTLATDYALAGVTGYLAWALYRKHEAQLSRRCWAVGFAALALLHGWKAGIGRDAASWWVLAAAALSALAATVQYGRIALHENFNHNDLYHLVQIAAMMTFCKAGKLMRDATSLPRQR